MKNWKYTYICFGKFILFFKYIIIYDLKNEGRNIYKTGT